jgi:nifR3 family TIM-barrel protein
MGFVDGFHSYSADFQSLYGSSFLAHRRLLVSPVSPHKMDAIFSFLYRPLFEYFPKNHPPSRRSGGFEPSFGFFRAYLFGKVSFAAIFMTRYREEFRLGPLVLPNNIFYAPMAGHTDLPFRRIVSQFCPGLFFCEMVKIEAVVRKCSETLRMLEYDDKTQPLGAQICGSDPLIAADAARFIEDLGFDLIDLNCGCPVDKVTKDGSGSALLRDLPLLRKILSSVVAAVKIPVTIKVRSGWDVSSLCVSELVQMAEELGAVAITIHGRTRSQKYEGFSNPDYIAKGKKSAKNILVIGNGDVQSASSARLLFEKTGCDGLMIARSALSTPWIVQEIRADSLQTSFQSPSPLEMLALHFSYLEEYYPPHKVIFQMKRIACYYLRGLRGVKKLRTICNLAKSPKEMKEAIRLFEEQKEVAYAEEV